MRKRRRGMVTKCWKLSASDEGELDEEKQTR